MAIRSHDVDYDSDQMKLHAQAHLGDITANAERTVFAAPFACEIKEIQLFTTNEVTNESGSFLTVQAHIAGASNSLLQSRSTSGTANGTFSANTPNVFTPSANNSLTTGTPVVLDFAFTSASAGIAISQGLCVVKYVPLLHRESN